MASIIKHNEDSYFFVKDFLTKLIRPKEFINEYAFLKSEDELHEILCAALTAKIEASGKHWEADDAEYLNACIEDSKRFFITIKNYGDFAMYLFGTADCNSVTIFAGYNGFYTCAYSRHEALVSEGNEIGPFATFAEVDAKAKSLYAAQLQKKLALDKHL
jgi:hypothetical protein